MAKKERQEEREVYEELASAGYDPDILREYDLITERARQVRGVIRLKTRSGYRMLKRVNVSEARLKFVFEALEYIYPRFSHVPRFIRTKYADPYVVTPQGLYYLTDWLPGREAELKKAKHLFLATEMLARLHQTARGYDARGFVDSGKDDFLNELETYRARLDSYGEAAADRDHLTPFDQEFLVQKDSLIRMMEETIQQLHVSPYKDLLQKSREEKTLCHGSYSKQNVLIDGKTVSIVDFDHCHFGLPIQDLGAFLHRYMPKYGWDGEVGQSILDVYQGVSPLSQEEIHVLAAYLAYPLKPVQIISWYYEGVRGWGEEKYSKQLNKAMHAEMARSAFVRSLVDAYKLSFWLPSYQEGGGTEEEEESPSLEELQESPAAEDPSLSPADEEEEISQEEMKEYEELVEQAVLTRVQKPKKRRNKTDEKPQPPVQEGLWVDEERIRSGNRPEP